MVQVIGLSTRRVAALMTFVLVAWLGAGAGLGLGTARAATPDEEQFNFAEGLLITKD